MKMFVMMIVVGALLPGVLGTNSTTPATSFATSGTTVATVSTTNVLGQTCNCLNPPPYLVETEVSQPAFNCLNYLLNLGSVSGLQACNFCFPQNQKRGFSITFGCQTCGDITFTDCTDAMSQLTDTQKSTLGITGPITIRENTISASHLLVSSTLFSLGMILLSNLC